MSLWSQLPACCERLVAVATEAIVAIAQHIEIAETFLIAAQAAADSPGEEQHLANRLATISRWDSVVTEDNRAPNRGIIMKESQASFEGVVFDDDAHSGPNSSTSRHLPLLANPSLLAPLPLLTKPH